MDILKTRNYKQFKLSDGNRDIVISHVNKIKDSITQRNLLELNPILVDKNLVVIDGQHRLEAAKALGIDIYYRISQDLQIEDMVNLNISQKNWGMNDYLKYYCEIDENINYIRLRDFINKEKITLNCALAMIGGNKNGKVNKAFKLGNFVMPTDLGLLQTLPQCRHVIDYIYKINGSCKYLNTAIFLKSLAVFLASDGVEFKKFMEALPRFVSTLTPQVNQANYLQMFEKVYNWGKKINKIEVS